jgi:hypothetical protein
MLQLSLAKELGMTLAEITDKVTFEELMIWNTFFELEHEQAKQKRR